MDQGGPMFKTNRYLLLDLFRKKSFKTDLVDGSKSCLEPINMALCVLKHVLQQMSRGEIADCGTVRDGRAKQFDVFAFKFKIGPK